MPPDSLDFDIRKALIVPVNPEGKIFIQDRRGYKKPNWGYFGGSIEDGEEPIDAVIREAKEELDVDIRADELKFLGTSVTSWNGRTANRYLHLYPTNRKEFRVLEGAGGHWLTLAEARERFDDQDRFDEVSMKIQEALVK